MKKNLLLILSLLAGLSLFAQDAAMAEPPAGEPASPTFQQETAGGDWTVSVGVAYRNFHNNIISVDNAARTHGNNFRYLRLFLCCCGKNNTALCCFFSFDHLDNYTVE